MIATAVDHLPERHVMLTVLHPGQKFRQILPVFEKKKYVKLR